MAAKDTVRGREEAGETPPQPGFSPNGVATRPLLMVDIDGVISLFGIPAAGTGHRPPSAAGSFHSIDGIPHFLSATAAAHLLSLAALFDVVWASGWEEKADEYLPRLLGLPAGLPHLSFPRAVGRSNAHWKLETIDTYAGARPLAWVDDALNGACHEWAAARRAPTLLVQTDPQRGLTELEAGLLSDWGLAHQGSRERGHAPVSDGQAADGTDHC